MRANGMGRTRGTTRVVLSFQVRRTPARSRRAPGPRRPGQLSLLELAGAGALGGAVVFMAAAVAQWAVGARHDDGRPAERLEGPRASADPRAPHAARVAPMLSLVAESGQAER